MKTFKSFRTVSVRGFSLIELAVVVGIFGMISILILANHSRFNSSVLLGSLAYDIALSIREAQVYGLSVKQFASDFQVGYGIHFEQSGSYIVFADVNANKRYDQSTDAVLELYGLGHGHRIARFCGETAAGVERCSDSSQGTQITTLDIIFLRPNPDANISSQDSSVYSRGIVTVSSPAGDTRTITVASTGQISVQ